MGRGKRGVVGGPNTADPKYLQEVVEDAPLDVRQTLRRLAGQGAKFDYAYPVKIERGVHRPTFKGHSYYHTTPNGKTIVRYPGAYKWPTEYHPSTLRVSVGNVWFKNWLLRQPSYKHYIVYPIVKKCKGE